MCSSFEDGKKQLLSTDNSRKGSVDKSIIELINYINEESDYYTTSSCSGRILVYQQHEDSNGHVKKGCQWLYVSHDQVCVKNIIASLENHKESAVLKFEPFIVHIRCASLTAAKLLNSVSIASGFRNSGITIGNSGKIMVAVRSTHGLEVPISCNGQLLVSEEYLQYVIGKANQKLLENQNRIDRFFYNLKKMSETRSKKTETQVKQNVSKSRTKEKSQTKASEIISETDEDEFEGISDLLET